MVERLDEIVVGAGAQGLHGSPQLGKHGDQDHRQLRTEILGFAHQLHAIHARHSEIRQQHVGVSRADQLQRLDSVLGQQRGEPLAVEEAPQQLSHFVVVLGDQDSALNHTHERLPCLPRGGPSGQITSISESRYRATSWSIPMNRMPLSPAPKVPLMRAAMYRSRFSINVSRNCFWRISVRRVAPEANAAAASWYSSTSSSGDSVPISVAPRA